MCIYFRTFNLHIRQAIRKYFNNEIFTIYGIIVAIPMSATLMTLTAENSELVSEREKINSESKSLIGVARVGGWGGGRGHTPTFHDCFHPHLPYALQMLILLFFLA